MVVCAPHELDGIADRGVHSEGDIAENTLGRRNDDGMGNTVSDVAAVRTGLGRGRGPWLRRATVLSKAFWVISSVSCYPFPRLAHSRDTQSL